MLRTRVITAVVLLALIGGAAAGGSTTLLEVLALLVTIAMYEWIRLAGCGVVTSVGGAVAYGALLTLSVGLDVRAPAYAGAAVSLAACAR